MLMGQTEIMYDIPSYLIAAIVFAIMVLAIFLGVAFGERQKTSATEGSKGQANAIQGSLLGLLALLLGFTFSLALGRFDQRSIEVVNEANAIGTAWLRTDLVGDAQREEAKALMRQYGAVRVQATQVSAADNAGREALIAEAGQIFGQLWQLGSAEARLTPNPVTMAFLASLNDMTDALSSRDAAINRHVPELVLFLLFGTFIMLGGVVGYSSAIGDTRPGLPVYAMMMLIVILVFLIIDLDRPRRGLIEVDQSTLIATVQAMTP